MWKSIIYVALGSALGGVARMGLQHAVQRRMYSTFPYGTLAVNVLGCFAIGIVYALAAKGQVLSAEARLFLATGLCGGFTTFSSFISENVTMLQDGEWMHTLVYTSLSLAAGVLATWLGAVLIKSL